MKLFTALSAATKLCLTHLALGEAMSNSSSAAGPCDLPCDVFDEYCELSTGLCRSPNYDGECFNPATGAYQLGCDPGFECVDNKCNSVYNTADDAASSDAGCGDCSQPGEFCDSILQECRGPSYDGECYNPVLGTFQDGCSDGYACMNNECSVVSIAPTDADFGSTCYLPCPTGSYCENGSSRCRGPSFSGECVNSVTGAYQDGCDPGYTCVNNKCSYVDVISSSNSDDGCGNCDVLGEFCDSITNTCRAPSYNGECYHLDSSTFHDGCDDGYYCVDSICKPIVPLSTERNYDDVCTLGCPSGTYCENGTTECRGPSFDGECFNPVLGMYQFGCDSGYECIDNQCVRSTIMASDASVGCDECDILGEHCDPILHQCRGVNYDGECFNPVVGAYQYGCDPGYTCVDNKCEYTENVFGLGSDGN